MDMPMTVAKVAERLGVSRTVVYGWVSSGELTHLRLGGRGKRGSIRVEQADLEVFLKRRRQGERGTPKAAQAPVKLRHLKL